jgi:hypothetical protein
VERNGENAFSDTYKGDKVISEPESRALREYGLAHPSEVHFDVLVLAAGARAVELDEGRAATGQRGGRVWGGGGGRDCCGGEGDVRVRAGRGGSVSYERDVLRLVFQ